MNRNKIHESEKLIPVDPPCKETGWSVPYIKLEDVLTINMDNNYSGRVFEFIGLQDPIPNELTDDHDPNEGKFVHTKLKPFHISEKAIPNYWDKLILKQEKTVDIDYEEVKPPELNPGK